eukprot:6082114-Pleurochrysis_carterae.AAC.1
MSSVDVLGPRVMLRVVCKIDSSFVINVQGRRGGLFSAQFTKKRAGPRNRSAVVDEHITRGRMARRPVRVREPD